MITASRHTLAANVAQQVSAALLLLALPNLLDKGEYAEIVFVAVLLSFGAFADLGFLQVYGRAVPALHAGSHGRRIQVWDATAMRFGLMSALLFSLAIATVYLFRYHHPVRALLLLPVPLLVYWFSLHATRASVTGDFRKYRNAIVSRSAAALTAIPLALKFGLTGWFSAQLLAAVFALASFGRRILPDRHLSDWALVKNHLREGLLLCAISACWLQLLNFGRLYASLQYGPEGIAHYGVGGAAYQSVSLLIISAFLPVSVTLLQRFGSGDVTVYEYSARTLRRTMPWLLAGAVVAAETAPYLLELLFRGYQFDYWLVAGLVLGIAFYPMFILLGNAFVGKRRADIYLAVIMAGLVIGTGSAMVIDHVSPGLGAAWGQLLGLASYTAMLYGAAHHWLGAKESFEWNQAGRYMLKVMLVLLLYIGLRLVWSMA